MLVVKFCYLQTEPDIWLTRKWISINLPSALLPPSGISRTTWIICHQNTETYWLFSLRHDWQDLIIWFWLSRNTQHTWNTCCFDPLFHNKYNTRLVRNCSATEHHTSYSKLSQKCQQISQYHKNTTTLVSQEHEYRRNANAEAPQLLLCGAVP